MCGDAPGLFHASCIVKIPRIIVDEIDKEKTSWGWAGPSSGTAVLTLFYAESNPTYFTRRGGGIYAHPMISREKSFLPNSFGTPKHLPKIGLHTKDEVLISKNKKMAAVLKSTSEIYRKNFINILHFLPLRTKMALAGPILDLDL